MIAACQRCGRAMTGSHPDDTVVCLECLEVPLPAINNIHRHGHLSVENLAKVQAMALQGCDVGLQTSPDGRIWICVNGVAFIRFKPKRK